MNDALSWILDQVQGVDPVLRTLFVAVGQLLETSVLVGLVVPGDVIVIVASTGVENLAEYGALIGAAIVGSLLGESIGFALGRFLGPAIRRSAIGRRIGERNWKQAEHYVAHRGGIAVFVSRFIPVLHSLVPLTVGMSAMRYRVFICWTAPACIIWAISYTTVGYLAAESYRQLSQHMHWAGIIFAAIILGFAIIVVRVKTVIKRREEKHMSDSTERAASSPHPDRSDTA